MAKRTPKPKVGRPSLSGKGPAERLEIKAPADLLEQLAALAAKQGQSVAECAREAFQLAIARGSTR